ncbi:unnamed protein product [Symbiodinium pilosum]|uniref:Protein kinase domain-containing protein n=1 Tax=Symbiodinium pilosum TaxID=2952 RepID=A0A812XM44_SYMPI|nr:unnamed protein product [Symbiodinium pilosum]
MPGFKLLQSVNVLRKVSFVSAGGDHALILLENGDVFAAGDNRQGQLGVGHNKAVQSAVRVGSDAPVKVVAAGCTHSLLVTESGDAYAFGDNNHGQLGTGTTRSFFFPVKMRTDTLPSKIVSAAAGCWFSLLLLESGAVYGVGQNSFGQLGVGHGSGFHLVPVQMQIDGQVIAVAAGCTHSLTLLATGEVFSTGDNIYGQLGLGNNRDQQVPARMLGGLKAVAIAAGTYHSVLLLETGEVAATGSNSHGQLGLGTSQDQVVPVKMLVHAPVKGIAAGDFHSVLLFQSGDVYAAGDNGYGQLGMGGWNELIQPEHLVLGPQLGAGGSAQVFRGHWKGQEVAVKRISGVAHLEAMKKEIDALRRLRHPRLVRFIGACVQPPLLLVVTEYMAGGSLHDCLFGPRKTVPLSTLQRWTIAGQTAEGLAFLHSQRVVHRDLKSMNILLDSTKHAKICDFGLAHQMCMESTHIARKLDGEGGSPRYMAPECYDAKIGKLTEKVDMWAAGCILIELFAGILPYADCQTMPQLTARTLLSFQTVVFVVSCRLLEPPTWLRSSASWRTQATPEARWR